MPERAGLLFRAWELDRAQRMEELHALLSPLSPEELAAEPELGILAVSARVRTGRHDEAAALAERLREPFRLHASPRLQRRLLNLEGLNHYLVGRHAEAEGCYLRVAALARAADDRKLLADAWSNLGILRFIRGDEQEALGFFRRALAVKQEVGDAQGVGAASNNLGVAYRLLGRPAEALRLLEEVDRFPVSRRERTANARERAHALSMLGQHAAARERALAALRSFEEQGIGSEVAETHAVLSEIAREAGDPEAARRHADAALALLPSGDPLVDAVVAEESARLAAAGDDAGRARADAATAARAYRALGLAHRVERLYRALAERGVEAAAPPAPAAAEGGGEPDGGDGVAARERAEVLFRAWELDRTSRFEDMYALLSPLPRADLAAEPELGVLLVSACIRRGKNAEAGELIELLREPVRLRGTPRLQRRLLNLEGQLLYFLGRYDEGERAYRRLEELSRAADDRKVLADAWINLGALLFYRLEPAEALGYMQRALALKQEVGDGKGVAACLNNLGVIYRELDRPADALRMFDLAAAGSSYPRRERAVLERERARALSRLGEHTAARERAQAALRALRELGIVAEEAESLAVLSEVERLAGDLAAARRHADQAAALLPTGELLPDALAWEESALVAAAAGDALRARADAGRAARAWRELGSPKGAERLARRLAELGVESGPAAADASPASPGEPGQGRAELLFRAWELDRASRMDELYALLASLSPADRAAEPGLAVLLASACLRTGRLREAAAAVRAAREACRGRGAWLERRVLNLEGQAGFFLGRYAEAEQAFARVAELARAAGDRKLLSDAWLNLGTVMWARCRMDDAAGYLRRALALKQEIGESRWIAVVYHNLGGVYCELGRPHDALRMFDAAERFPMSRQHRAGTGRERARALSLLGEHAAARELALATLRVYDELGVAHEAAATLEVLVEIALRAGDVEEARRHVDRAVALLPTEEVLTDGCVWEKAALVAAAEGRVARARADAARAERIFRRIGAPLRAERMHERLDRAFPPPVDGPSGGAGAEAGAGEGGAAGVGVDFALAGDGEVEVEADADADAAVQGGGAGGVAGGADPEAGGGSGEDGGVAAAAAAKDAEPSSGRVEILFRAWELDRTSDMEELYALLAGLSPEDRAAEPELAVLLASACVRIGLYREAAAAVEAARAPVRERGTPRLRRRLLNLEGQAHFFLGRYAEAEDAFLRVAAEARAAGDRRLLSDAWINLAAVAWVRCELVEAYGYMQRALVLKRQAGDVRWVAVAFHNLGGLYRELGRHADALRMFDQAEWFPFSRRERALTLRERARALAGLGEHAAARELGLAALRRFEELRIPDEVSASHAVLAEVALAAGDVAGARRDVDRAVATLPSGDAITDGLVWEQAALVAAAEGRAGRARADAARAARVFGELGAPLRAERTWERLARALPRVEEPPVAALAGAGGGGAVPGGDGPPSAAGRVDVLFRAWELDRVADMEALYTLLAPLPRALLAAEPELGVLLASACLRRGKYPEGMALVELLRTPCRERGTPRLQRRLLNLEGQALYFLGRYAEAERAFGRLAELARAAGDRRALSDAWVNAGAIVFHRGDAAESLGYFQRALALKLEVGDWRWIFTCYNNIGVAYRDLGRPADAQRLFDQAERFPAGRRERANLERERARVLSLAGEHAAARELAASAQRAFEEMGILDEVAIGHGVLAELAVRAGSPEAALRSVERALVLLPSGDALTDGLVWEEAAAAFAAAGDLSRAADAAAHAAGSYLEIAAFRRVERLRERLAPWSVAVPGPGAGAPAVHATRSPRAVAARRKR